MSSIESNRFSSTTAYPTTATTMNDPLYSSSNFQTQQQPVITQQPVVVHQIVQQPVSSTQNSEGVVILGPNGETHPVPVDQRNQQPQTNPNEPATGLVHSMKKSFSSSSKELEPEYESAVAKFENLKTATRRLKDYITSYIRNVFALNENQYNLAVSFNNLLAEDASNPYASITQEMYNSHRILLSGREKAATQELANSVLRRLDEQIASYNLLQDRLGQIQEYKQEYDYYLGKIDNLRAQRDKALLSKKEQSQSEIQRYERNVNKARVAEERFKQHNYRLVSEVNNLWGRRVTVIGPALLDFINAERQLNQLQQEVLDGIRTQIDPDQANREYMQNYNEILPTDVESTSASLVLAETGLQNVSLNDRKPDVQVVAPRDKGWFGDESPLEDYNESQYMQQHNMPLTITDRTSSQNSNFQTIPVQQAIPVYSDANVGRTADADKSGWTSNLNKDLGTKPIISGDYSAITNNPDQAASTMTPSDSAATRLKAESVSKEPNVLTTTEYDKTIVGDHVKETRKDERILM